VGWAQQLAIRALSLIVGNAPNPQVTIQAFSGIGEITFPTNAAAEGSPASMVSGFLSGSGYSAITFQGPALAAAGKQDYMYVIIFSNDTAGQGSHLDIVSANSGSPGTVASFNDVVINLYNPVDMTGGASITGGLTVDTINGSANTGTALPAGVPTGGPNGAVFAGHTHDFDGHTHPV
jgi:hypothetical protein